MTTRPAIRGNAHPQLTEDRRRLVDALRKTLPLIARGRIEGAYTNTAAGPQYADRVLAGCEALLRELGEEYP